MNLAKTFKTQQAPCGYAATGRLQEIGYRYVKWRCCDYMNIRIKLFHL